MRSRKDTAFTVELLGLFILLMMVIVTVTQVFVMSRAHSLRAEQITEAVILAENTAETSSAAPDPGELEQVLSAMENVQDGSAGVIHEDADGSCRVCAVAKLSPDSRNVFLIILDRENTAGPNGTYSSDRISIYDAKVLGITSYSDIPEDIGASDPVYELGAGTYFEGRAGS